MLLTYIITFVSIIVTAESRSLPSYIKPCKTSDPMFEKCLLEHGNEAIPFLVKGDKSFKIPSLLPLIVPEVQINSGPDYKMKFINVTIFDLDKLRLYDAKSDFSKHKSILYLHSPITRLFTTYDINAKLLMIPFIGTGHLNFTLVRTNYTFNIGYKEVAKDDGEEYLEIDEYNIDIVPERAYFDFDDLFHGNRNLGQEMNKLLNEQWKDAFDEFIPVASKVIADVAMAMAKKIYENVPLKELLPK